MSSRAHFLEPLLTGQDPVHVLRIERTAVVVASRLEVAFDSRARRRGLLGRSGLSANAVLIIAPCNSVHTFFMQFAIDVVFVDRAGTVLKIYRSLKPWRIGFAAGAFATLELAASAIRRSGIAVGDRLVVEATPPGI